MSTPVRVVLADDHPMFRYGVAAVLAEAPDVELVGEADNGRELLDVVARTQPDVVLTDLAMPGLDGAGATRELTGGGNRSSRWGGGGGGEVIQQERTLVWARSSRLRLL